jgi:glycosyltransferase involved in cell wall biosynthesis
LKTIFISTPWFHPAYKAGGPVQSIVNMVNELEAYSFYIFCSNQDLDGLPLDVADTDKWVDYNAHTKVWYAGAEQRSQRLTEQVKLIRPDLLYMVGIYSWHFTIVPLFFTNVPEKILSVRGMLHPGALGEKALKKKLFLQVMKWLRFTRKCSIHVTDQLEGDHVKAVLGNGVRMYEAGNFPRRMEPLTLPLKEIGTLRLISIALISPMKNILLVLQALKECRSQVSYDIYGPVKDAGYWAECLQAIGQLPENISVRYHKEVQPAEVPSKLMHAQVFILPSKSENFGHSIYEALAAGLPVITSEFTPWNHLMEEKAGVNVKLDMVSLARAIEDFAGMNNEAFLMHSRAASAYAARYLDIGALRSSYRAMFG